MLDVHPPHQSAHSWRDFFIHIATIVIGLLIAVGLEQVVEFVHHRHQRDRLEAQMLEVMAQDRDFIVKDLDQLQGFRDNLVELQTAVAARLKGKKAAPPPRIDPRAGIRILMPNLAPLQAARENGTVALLDSERIRLYNRVAFQRDLIEGVTSRWVSSLHAMDAFRKRYETGQDSRALGMPVPTVDISHLEASELVELRAIVGTALDNTDEVIGRLSLMSAVVTAMLDGAKSESELMTRAGEVLRSNVDAAGAKASSNQP